MKGVVIIIVLAFGKKKSNHDQKYTKSKSNIPTKNKKWNQYFY